MIARAVVVAVLLVAAASSCSNVIGVSKDVVEVTDAGDGGETDAASD